jgi:hypothetical protein
MTLVEDRTQQDRSPEVAGTPVLDARAWLGSWISGRRAVGVAAAWFVLYSAAAAVEPPTHHEEPFIAEVIAFALLGVMVVMAFGLLATQRWGLVASLGAATLLVAASVACPTTGHHPIGAWWFAQMACAFALVGVSVAALRRA